MDKSLLPILIFLGLLTISYTRDSYFTIPSPPRIVKQPPTDEVLFQVGIDENDKPFFIECEAEGEPTPQYYWIKNGKNFTWQVYDDRISQQEGRGTLSIAKPQEVDIGQYQCFAWNKYGVATSNSVFMRKAELNSFKSTSPTSITAQEGEPFKLSCQPPDGWPKPKVDWVFQYIGDGLKTINNSRMTVDPEGNLWFSNLTLGDTSDNFYYACSAASVTKLEYKVGNRVLLNVISAGVSGSQNKHEPVQQYVTRKNEVAYRGKNIELFCIYGGTPLPHTMWTKDGRSIEYSDRITQNNYGKSLVLKLVDFEDEGTYTCEVSNGVGQAQSYSIKLKVLAVPYFTVEPEFINAADGETVEFKCNASGVPNPVIKWIHNGRPIAEAPPNDRRIVGSNNIIIRNLNKNDTGNYGCNATNSIGYVYKDVYVNVLELQPEIIEMSKDIRAVNDKTITIKCRVFGAPKPLVKWIRDGKELTGGKYSVQSNGDLVISSVQYDDSGDYICFAQNKFGTVNKTVKFTVMTATRITDGPEDYEVRTGSQATFKCNAVVDPDLDLEILWQKDGETIEIGTVNRFVISDDHTLTISNTIELDSGIYTCIAKTELDEVSAQAKLTVQDVPNAPAILNVVCQKKDAIISWRPMGDNRAPITHYTIQYNTSFPPSNWDTAYKSVPAADSTFNVPMSPWANYTFRVIAWNKIGASPPSAKSDMCTTLPEVPHKNPDNVVGEGDRPTNLVIKWTPMPEIEHNAPKFQYRVYWKRDIPGQNYETIDVTDWRQSQVVIENQPSFQQYRIKVIAINEMGEANVSPKEVIGYSGEDVPEEAPSNFTLIQIHSGTTALLSWNPVSLESVHGHFKGYKIRTWSDSRNGDRIIQVQGDVTQALVTNFIPYSRNYAQVYVYNGKHDGPRSETLSFDTPEGVPGQMSHLEALPLGSNAFRLTWSKPDEPNGILTGYKISYAFVNGTKVYREIEGEPILDPNRLHTKLGGLQPNSKYRIYISATTKEGASKKYFIEATTRPLGHVTPGIPSFLVTRVPSNNDNFVSVKVTWIPDRVKPGSHFFVKYKKKGETTPIISDSETNEDYIIINNLTPGQVYEFIVVSVDGNYFTESEPQEVDTYAVESMIQPGQNMASAGWFIGMMLAIAFLLLVLIMVCIIKRNRGGKYAVHEREQANGRHDYPDEGGFHEYSQPLDNKSRSKASMGSDQKIGPESDTDSMAEYGEGDTEGMNEDGSFIGQYGRQRKQGETTSQGFATLV